MGGEQVAYEMFAALLVATERKLKFIAQSEDKCGETFLENTMQSISASLAAMVTVGSD